MTGELPLIVRTWCVLCGWQFRLDEELPCPSTLTAQHLLSIYFNQLPAEQRRTVLEQHDCGVAVTFDARSCHQAICVLCGTNLHEPYHAPCFYPRRHVTAQEWNGLTECERHLLHEELKNYLREDVAT